MERIRAKGYFNGFGVIVNEPEEIHRLYNYEGYFGKGVLSRSNPCFVNRTKRPKNQGTKKQKIRSDFHAKDITPENPFQHLDFTNFVENLQLSLVEAFYLLDALDIINIYFSINGEWQIIEVEECWKKFIQSEGQNFVYHYCVYCHFRNQKWIVRGGLKYGVDYVLYANAPSKQHAQYSVLVMATDMDTTSMDLIDPKRFSSYSDVHAISRVSEQVAKELMFCYVVEPSGLTSSDYNSPNCLSLFAIKEVIIKRFDPTKVR